MSTWPMCLSVMNVFQTVALAWIAAKYGNIRRDVRRDRRDDAATDLDVPVGRRVSDYAD